MQSERPDLRYMLARIRGIARPPLTITEPPREGVVFERDVPVRVRDGAVLRVNVFRPAATGPHPVLMCAHPYNKDALPAGSSGRYAVPFQYRMFRADRPITFSAWTNWEAPDPAFWVPRGYVLVNADLRGFGGSEGVGELLSAKEGEDYHDLIEWAAAQPWSSGKVGLLGVSYLALSQWRAAAARPAHLAAIAPWEGFSDVYRDFARPGGVREDGFVRVWSSGVKRGGRATYDMRAEQLARPLWDAWWQARLPDLARIEVPLLVCGSFSDHDLHSRGSFAGYERAASREKWLYTHRGGKWATFYSDEAKAFQQRFFDCFLKGEDRGMRATPRVRLEVRERGDRVHVVRGEAAWPLPDTRWTKLFLGADGALGESPATRTGTARFHTRAGRASFAWRFARDTELSGPMAARLFVSVAGADDVSLFVGVRKLDARGVFVGFEGSYGFGYDLVTRGLLKVSQRALDPERSRPWQPVHSHLRAEKLRPGQVVPVDVELLPSATLFRAGETLRLDIQGHYFFPRDPLRGQFPAGYEPSARATATLHFGGEHDAHLLVPVIPPR